MSFRIFNSVDLVVIIDTKTFDVEKHPFDTVWYNFNNLAAPILYSIYKKDAERPFLLDQPFTEFQDKNGNGFDNDVILQAYLDDVLGRKEINTKLETVPQGKDNLLLIRDETTNRLLKELLIEMKINNLHLSEITAERFTQKDT